MKNDAWSGYFEDIEIQIGPVGQPEPVLGDAHGAVAAPASRRRPALARRTSAHLLAWATQTFGGDTATERGTQWGATVMSEQAADMAKMGSHTARFGATDGALVERPRETTPAMVARGALTRVGDLHVRRARASSTVGEDKNEGWWFSDGYGDYIRHFLVAMGAVPEWAPPRREPRAPLDVGRDAASTTARAAIAWTTFDADATETLRLVSRPATVTSAGDGSSSARTSTTRATSCVRSRPAGS